MQSRTTPAATPAVPSVLAVPLSVLLLVLLPALLAAGPSTTQEGVSDAGTDAAVIAEEDWEPVDTFADEVAVDVVNVAVWVTDRNGLPVTGFGRDDFVLLVEGEPVELANFAAYEGADELPPRTGTLDARPSDPPPWVGAVEEEPTPEPPTLTEEESGDALHLAVLIDDWNLRPEDRGRVLDDLRTFLEERLQPGDRVALVVHDRALQLVQRFTADRRTLSAALDRIEEKAPSGLRVDSEKRSALGQIQEAFRRHLDGASPFSQGSPCKDGWGELEGAAHAYAAAVQGHVHRSGGALASMAGILAGLPGRKLVLYVGNGLAQTAGVELFQFLGEICSERQSDLAFYHREYDMTWLYDEVVQRANAAGVTFYTMEAEVPSVDLGLENLGGGTGGGARGARISVGEVQERIDSGQEVRPGELVGEGGGGSFARFRESRAVQRTGEFDRESSLVMIARETGGRSFLNAADFSADFERLALDMRSYYSLGFTPPDPADGRLHRIEVRLAEEGGDYRVRHRESYQAKPLEHRMMERVLGVAQFGGGANPLEVRVEVGESTPGDAEYRVPLRIWVPLSRLTLTPGADGTLTGRVRVLMSATDENGELVPVRQKVVPVEVLGGGEALAGEQLIEVDLDLAPGEHTVVLGVRDGVGGETAYLTKRFPVPTASGGRGEDS